MASSREASIRLSLRSGGFQSGVRRITRGVAASGRKMGVALKQSISAGLSSARQSLAGFGSELKGHLKTAATLGGAVSLGAAVKTAMDAERAYLQASTALSTFSKQNVTAAETQEMVERVAGRTKVPIEELQGTLMQLASVAGKVDIEPLLERASSQARRLAMNGEFVGRVYTRLVAKGVAKSAEEAENLTEQFNTLFRSMLGVDLDEAIDPMDVSELAGFINTTGNSAAEMLKLISLGGEKIAKDFGKANEIVEELGLSLRQSKGVTEMTKKLKLKKGVIDSNKSALENMLAIAEKGPKKFAAMADALSGDIAGQALKEIVGEELVIKASTGKVTKKEWQLRVGQLRKELADLGDLAVDRKRIEAIDLQHKQTLNAKVDDAMNKLKAAFADEKMHRSLEKMAKALPTLADLIADFVEFVAENPLKAAAGAVGLKVGGAALSGAAGSLMTGVAGKLLGTGAAGAAGAGAAGAGAAGAAKGGLLVAGAKGVGGAVFSGLAQAGAPYAGASAGAGGAAMMAAGGVAAAGAAGALVGHIVHEQVLDPMAKADFESLENVGDFVFEASRARTHKGATVEDKQQALDALRIVIEKMKEGPSMWTTMVGEMAAAYTDTESATTKYQDALEKLRDEEFKLEKSLKKQWEGQSSTTRNMEDFAGAVTKLTGAFDELGGRVSQTGANGVPSSTRGTKHVSSKPGAEPVSG